MEFIHRLGEWVVHWAYTPYAIPALFSIAVAESSFFPIPPDVLLITLCLIQPEKALLYACICSIGSVIGGGIGYLIGLKGGRPLLLKLFSKEKISFVENQYKKYDVWAVGIAGFTPIPYKVFTISAGVFTLNFLRFIIASVISRSSRFFLIAGLIYMFGPTIQNIIRNYFDILSIAFLILLIGGFYFIKIAYKNKAKKFSDP